uniref:EF-hand domain-containing protein n=1 Tax=Salix viminalis TaxID=40686 RepID=A0A6N2KXQ8_SALVM
MILYGAVSSRRLFLHQIVSFIQSLLTISIPIPYDVATKTRDKPLTAKQVREIFMRHVKDPDNNELKAAFSELGASYPDFRADRALMFADANGDGLIATQEMDELVCYAWLLVEFAVQYGCI